MVLTRSAYKALGQTPLEPKSPTRSKAKQPPFNITAAATTAAKVGAGAAAKTNHTAQPNTNQPNLLCIIDLIGAIILTDMMPNMINTALSFPIWLMVVQRMRQSLGRSDLEEMGCLLVENSLENEMEDEAEKM